MMHMFVVVMRRFSVSRSSVVGKLELPNLRGLLGRSFRAISDADLCVLFRSPPEKKKKDFRNTYPVRYVEYLPT
jgi:hypothetical protein